MLAGDLGRLKACLFLWGTSEGLFIYLLPLYIRALGGGATVVGLVAAIQFAVAGVSTLLAGPIVDRIGHRPFIRFAGIISIPGMVIWTVAPSWQWIIPGVVFFALGFAVVPALNAYVTAGHDDHVGAFGSTFAFFSLGMILTPGIGGFIANQAHSIRPVFALSLALYAASVVVVWGITPHPVEPHEPLKVVARALASNRRLLALGAYLVALLFVSSMTNSFVGPFLQDVDRVSDATVGLLGSCISLGEFLCGLALGRVNARLGRVWTLIVLQAAVALSLVGVLVVHWAPLLVIAFILRGAIVTGANLVLALVGGMLPARQQGAGFGLMELGFQVGMMLAAYTGGLLYAAGATYPFIVSLALLGALAGATRLFSPLFVDGRLLAVAPEVHAAR